MRDLPNLRGWTGGGETGIREAGDGGKGTGDGGRGDGDREILGADVLPKFVVFGRFYSIFMYWVSEVYNRRTEANSGIFTMNPALISLHRRGVFRQPWFILNSFTSDFGLSLVDYFPLIPKVNKIALVGGNPHFFFCVEVLRPSQPNGVMSSAVSLPNHTFTGQA